MAPEMQLFLPVLFYMFALLRDERSSHERSRRLHRLIRRRREALSRRRLANEKAERLRFVRHIARRREYTSCFLHALSAIASGPRVDRLVHNLPKSTDWWEKIVLGSWTNDQWLSNFRMSKATFAFLVDSLQTHVRKMDTNMRRAIRVDHRLAITLWRLATNIEFRTIGHLFGVGKSTCCVIVRETCEALKTALGSRVKMLSGERLQQSLRGFESRHGLPQVAGVVGGTHVPIRAPHDNPRDYYNRKRFFSVILQAAVDFQGRFVDLNIGWPGSVRAARVLANSSLYQKLVSDRTLFPPTLRDIQGVDVPVMLLGGQAYPLTRNLMKGFGDADGPMTRRQQIFNARLSGARSALETALGRLKARWRILDKRNGHHLKNVPLIVLACCILHNVCEERGEPFQEHWLHELQNVPVTDVADRYRGHHEDEAEGIAVRNALMQHMVPDDV